MSLMPPSTESDSEEEDGEELLQELHGPAAPSSSHIVFDCSGRSGWAGESGSSSSAPGEESRSHPSTSEKPIKTLVWAGRRASRTSGGSIENHIAVISQCGEQALATTAC